MRANRAFLARTVRFLARDAGIRQFLDIGTGIPTANNTHEIAQQEAPDSRIVCVDNDPIVLAHAEAMPAHGRSAPDGRYGSAQRAARPGRLTMRPRAEIAAYFDGLDFVEPGLVPLPEWRGVTNPAHVIPCYAGIARKP